jgi:hypothetical protein
VFFGEELFLEHLDGHLGVGVANGLGQIDLGGVALAEALEDVEFVVEYWVLAGKLFLHFAFY